MWHWLLEKLRLSARFIGSLVVIVILLMFVDVGWRHANYYLADRVTATEVAETLSWRADTPFQARLRLDWNHAVHHADKDHDYTLVPIYGAGGRLAVIMAGSPDQDTVGLMPTLEGRIVGPNWFGEWDAGELSTEVHLRGDLAKSGMRAAPDALLLVPGWRPTLDSIWQMFLAAVTFLVMMVFAFFKVLVWWHR